VEQSSELAVRREVCYGEVFRAVFVRQVFHSARHQTGRGDERLVYHPKYPIWHGILPPVGSTTWCPAWGTRSVSTWGSRWHIQRTHTCEEIPEGAVRVRA
jgi:hypothetical protein